MAGQRLVVMTLVCAAFVPCGHARAEGPDGPAVGATTQSSSATAATPDQIDRERNNARVRIRQDPRRFARLQLDEAERLAALALGQWPAEEARRSAELLVRSYPELNRAGCTLLLIGQAASGTDRETYLKQAIRHGDCYFAGGVQVGAFARYLLAHHYLKEGKPAEAQRLFDEIRRSYPNAITEGGEALVAVMREPGLEVKAATQPVE